MSGTQSELEAVLDGGADFDADELAHLAQRSRSELA